MASVHSCINILFFQLVENNIMFKISIICQTMLNKHKKGTKIHILNFRF